MWLYHVFFTHDVNAYHVVEAKNVKQAVQRAKRSCRARLISFKKRPLSISKIEKVIGVPGKVVLLKCPSK